MKCNFCGKEINSDYCVYCGQTQSVIEESTTPQAIQKLNMLMVLSYIALAIAVFANEVVYLAIGTLIICVYLIIYILRKYKSNVILKKTYITILGVAIVSLIIASVPTINVVKEVIDRNTFAKTYSEQLGIDLPGGYATDYQYEVGYQTGVRIVYYETEITKAEYADLLITNSWYTDANNYFLKLVNAKKANYYLIYNCDTKTFDIPTDKVEFHYILLQVTEAPGYYTLRVYDVMNRSY